jgi:type VI secretion system protein ImpF
MSRIPGKTRDDGVANVPRRAGSHMMPTLLDRLRDDAPHRQSEAPGEYTISRSQMRDIIQRDLAYLLNAINIEDQIDGTRYPDAERSTVNFGMPPLAGSFVVKHQWNDIERKIKDAITVFEPRILEDSLSIAPLVGVDTAQYNNLSFEIRGMIRMDPYPMEFMVQSSLDLETSRLHAAGRRGT